MSKEERVIRVEIEMSEGGNLDIKSNIPEEEGLTNFIRNIAELIESDIESREESDEDDAGNDEEDVQ